GADQPPGDDRRPGLRLCERGRGPGRVGAMTRLVALVSGFGWHVQDLRRAAETWGVRLDAVPFPKVIGRVGAGPPRIEAGGIDLAPARGVLGPMVPPRPLPHLPFP